MVHLVIVLVSHVFAHFVFAETHNCQERVQSGLARWVSGVYRNVDYGYKLTVPAHVLAIGSADSAPNHGIHVCLCAGECSRYMAIDAFDDSAEFSSPDRVADVDLASLRTQRRKLTVDVRQHERLDGMEAVHTLVTYSSALDNSGPATREDKVTALRSVPGDESGIIYTMRLITDSSHYTADMNVFRTIKTTFRQLPIN